MKEEVFESVLNEILEDQKLSTGVIKDLQTTVADLAEKVAAFDQRLNEQVMAPPADTGEVQKVIDEGLARIEQHNLDNMEKTNQALTATFEKISAIVEAQPKAVVRQVRFLTIPERDPDGNFKHVVSKVLLWILGMTIALLLYFLAQQWLSSRHY